MPAPSYQVDRTPITVGKLQSMVQQFEADARRAVPELASRAAGWLALESEARKLGVSLRDALGADLYARNVMANRSTVLIVGALAMLDDGRAELIPYRVGNDPTIRFGIGPARSIQLGFAWVPALLWFAGTAAVTAFAAAGLWVTDAVLTLKQTQANTAAVQQDTIARLTTMAQRLPPAQQGAVVQALANIQAAIAAPPSNWLDSLAASVRNVSEGVATAVAWTVPPLALVAVLWFLSQRKKKKG